MANPMLQVRDITFKFSEQAVFNQFSADIPPGITYVIGDESSGKSTLLRLIAGDLKPQSGTLNVDNLVACQSDVFWIDPRTNQHDQRSPETYFDLQRDFYPAFDEAVLLDMIEGLSLGEHLPKAMYMLSAGSKRKVWLAAAFASSAKLTLLDEPFAALDKASINFLIEKLNSITQQTLQTQRAWVITDYEVPQQLSGVHRINLSLS